MIALESRDIKTAPRATNSGATATKGCGPLSRTQDTPDGFCQCGCGRRTKVPDRTHSRDGQVKGVPLRYVQGHHKRLLSPEYIVEDRGYETPCWIWQRARNPGGYGYTKVPGQRQGVLAHRCVYEREVGPIPAGLQLDHLCRVRCCVNPDHLEPVTNAENTRRGYESRRQMTANSSETT